MPPLSNARHEKFAQGVAKGLGITEAYAEAGYAPTPASASRLLTDAKVRARVDELQSRSAEKAEMTLEKLIGMAERAYHAAFDRDQIGAAVSAVKEIGVLSGLRVEKSERKNTHDIRDLSDADLDAAIARLAAGEEEEAPRRATATH